MSFPEAFLTEIARQQHLTEKETQAFLCVFGKQGKTMTRQAIADSLHIYKSTLGTRLSGIYKKFSFCDDGPGKENDLRQHLMGQLQTWQTNNSTVSEDAEPDIDAQVQKVRNAIQSYIQEKCGTMRVLDMSQPIGLGEIYTHVNILERITSRIGREMADLIEKVDREQVDRFCLGNVREKRVPGLEAVEKYAKLMVLGKPGAGKSTFLKHLAMQCIGGKFQATRVPIFVTLKDFADKPGQPDLLTYLDTYLKKDISLAEVVRGERGLLLLDGLDEVREADSSRVLRQIEEISQQFPQNQYIITCRIAAQEYRFESFTEVEIADFDDKQIADFSGKWFGNKNDPVKAERFAQKLEEDKSIRELASSPLLLTLLCLVFEDSGSFPGNRAELYQTGVDVLLKKWDATRNIERDVVYQKLSLKRKQDLLGNVAYGTFKAGDYFFKQRQVERYISQYIENLPGASTDPEALECDSAAVLKSIEAQHGLFVERARGIYSFSHLTFHEYFTAQKLVTRCNPEAIDDPSLQELVSHVTDKRWREVFLLAVGMLDSADVLLRLMKERIDRLLAGDEKLQQFLRWVDEKARSVKAPYPTYILRAMHFAFSGFQILEIGIYPHKNSHNKYMIDYKFENKLLKFDGNGFRNDLCLDDFIDKQAFLYFGILPSYELKKTYIWNGVYFSLLNFEFHFILGLAEKNQNIYVQLNQVIEIIPDIFLKVKEAYMNFCRKLKKVLTKETEPAIFEYKIQKEFNFQQSQTKILEQYYEANQLLIDCLNSDCYVSREVRQEIEDTLLLPFTQIEQQRG